MSDQPFFAGPLSAGCACAALLAGAWAASACGAPASSVGDGADAEPPDARTLGTTSPDATGETDVGSRDAETGGGRDAGADRASGDDGAVEDAGGLPAYFPYKDTSISLDWNTNVASTEVSGASATLVADMAAHGLHGVMLAFATGECGQESWGGVAGDVMASANVPPLVQAGLSYDVSTGGANGSFTCGSDDGMSTFIGRWASSGLTGIDFDIESGGASGAGALVARLPAAHAAHPALEFSFTLATLAPGPPGSSTAASLGQSAPDGFNAYGDAVMTAIQTTLGFDGTAVTWPDYVAINLMTMDYGGAGAGNCVVRAGVCDMGQSALQAAYDLHDHWGVPYAGIELTPMLGQNDTASEQFTLGDVDTVAAFAISAGLGRVHAWSYDRDTDCSTVAGTAPDCSTGSASPTRSSMGKGYAGPLGYLARFLADGLR